MEYEWNFVGETGLDKYFPEYESVWVEANGDPIRFIQILRARDVIDDAEYVSLYKSVKEGEESLWPDFEMPWFLEPKVIAPATAEAIREEISDAIFDKVSAWFVIAWQEYLKKVWEWLLEKLKDLIDLVVNTVVPALEQAWALAKAKLDEVSRLSYDGIRKLFDTHSPIKPEDAPTLALKLFGFAWTQGLAAQGISYIAECIHPLKRVGFHQSAAMLGELSGFGRIGGATMGTYINRVLGQAMTYYVQNEYRPLIPRESLLIEFAAKREIDKNEFFKWMAYQGFSDYWSNIIYEWQWKDPRMFEIIRLADVGLDQGTPRPQEEAWLERFGVTGERRRDWWLYRKFMRAGYEDCDLDVMVNFIHRREVAFALTYVRTAMRRNYRWGWMSDEELDSWIDRLKLPAQAKEWIFWAGQLDREHFYKQDLVTYYKNAFRNDVIDEDEFSIGLQSTGLPARESDIIVRTEKVKKKPKPARPVATAVKKPLTEAQKKYVQLYREQYRKGLITEPLYEQSLLAIGLAPELAEVTVALERTKLAPAVPA